MYVIEALWVRRSDLTDQRLARYFPPPNIWRRSLVACAVVRPPQPYRRNCARKTRASPQSYHHRQRRRLTNISQHPHLFARVRNRPPWPRLRPGSTSRRSGPLSVASCRPTQASAASRLRVPLVCARHHSRPKNPTDAPSFRALRASIARSPQILTPPGRRDAKARAATMM